jgi:3-hydroxybutyryl-CoA dehydrogenase
MTTVAVIGLGAMGLGIAQVFAVAGMHVLCTDANPDARAQAPLRLATALATRVSAGKMDAATKDAVLGRITIVADASSLADADLVIEAIVEDHAAKADLLKSLEPYLSPSAVLATNTSSLSVAALARALAHPERLLGLHFFNPATAMRLVELIAHPGTSAAALKTARDATEAAGKTVISAPDTPGFIVNRCARPFYGEALALLEEGRTAAEIDGAMQAAGYRLGPFALIDLIGADVNLAATEGVYAAFGNHPRYYPFAALRRRVASGHLGRKSGMGFVYPDVTENLPPDAQSIVTRIEATLVNEAAWLFAAKGVTMADIDTALKLGMNFPRGPFEIMTQSGIPKIQDLLSGLAAAAPPHLLGRYAPAPMLETA